MKAAALQKMLVGLSDKSGETLAVCIEAAERGDLEAICTNVEELHLLIWQLRWELAPQESEGGGS